MADPTRLEVLSRQYGLDGGGHEFEEPPTGLSGLGAVIWTDPDPDYVPWVHGCVAQVHGFYALSCPVYVFAANSGHFSRTEWPASYQDEEDVYVLGGHGTLNETDHDCDCYGKLVPWSGAAGEPTEPVPPGTWLNWFLRDKLPPEVRPVIDWQIDGVFWEFTGNSQDSAHPDCPKCEGGGTFPSEGGEWALYTLKEEKE